ncbi:MAG: endonuclease [candidate division Zixibacteria bacterium SM23_73_2]|nr:MAG: endonuclease [candidate division Zixibacteria bacterium SM23_73_2]
MSESLRIATFNLENLDDKADKNNPPLNERIAVMKPQLIRTRADVLCLQEVHGQEEPNKPRQLSALKKLLVGTPYQTYHLATTKTTKNEVYDKRNLVVLSRFPMLGDPEQFRHDFVPKIKYKKFTAKPLEDAEEMTWERPILYVKIDLGQNRTLHLINLHLKSKLPIEISGQKHPDPKKWYIWLTVAGWAEGYFLSSMKRVGQALETRILIDKIFEDQGEDSLVAVCGDFNADFDSVPVNAIRGPVDETNNPDLVGRIMAPCELTVPESSRYSFLHLGKGAMLDHILVSRKMLTFYRDAEIHNEILPDESGAFRTDIKFPESDHAPVVAEFVLP